MKTSLSALILLLMCGQPALAHHSFAANFDVSSTIELEGEITAVIWRNPHIKLTVAATDGTVWTIESHSVSNVARMNISRDILAIGESVKIAGYPARRAKDMVFMTHILFANGREAIFQEGAAPRWSGEIIGTSAVLHGEVEESDPSKRPNTMFAVWTTDYDDRGSWPLFPRTSENHPLTDEARAVMATFDVDKYDPLADCRPKGMPSAMAQPYPIELVDAGDKILLRIEEYDAVREIIMTDTHDEGPPAGHLGYSTGRWDGDTLIVTTSRIDFAYMDVLALPTFIPQSPQMYVVETFKLREGGNFLDYEMVVTDPATLKEPMSFRKFWKWRPGAAVQPYECED